MRWRIDFFRRRREERELAEEVESHLEEKIADLMDAGMPAREARETARKEFGNAARYREISREVWGWVWLETMLQDLRYGARMLRKNPGFTSVAVATLALGIGVNTTIFSLVSGWLLKKPAVRDPDRVVVVVATNPARAVERALAPAVDYFAWRDGNHVFDDMAAADAFHDFSLTGAGEPERLSGMRVTANYFRTLGVQAFLGRTFLPDEDRPGRDRVAVLTYGLWQRRFASDPGVIGKTVSLDGEKYVVIGVMPASFRQVEFLPRIWTPLVLAAQDRGTEGARRPFVLAFRAAETGRRAQASARRDGRAGAAGGAKLSRIGKRLGRGRHDAAGVRHSGRPHSSGADAADDRRRAGSGDRLREHRQFAAGAGRQTPAGDRDSNGVGRRAHARRSASCWWRAC